MPYRWQQIRDNSDLRARLVKRAEIIAAIRDFFRARGFLEAETPALVASPGTEPNLSPFEVALTDEKGASKKAALITSPEYALKKLLAAGLPKVFELARVFRNGEPQGGFHNPEFTMLEWYRLGADYTDIMRDVEELVNGLAVEYILTETKDQLSGDEGEINTHFQGKDINLAPPWERLSVREAFLSRAGIDLDKITSAAAFLPILKKKGYAFSEKETFETLFHRLFLTEIEQTLGQSKPTILYDYPAELAALARVSSKNGRYAERFEVYVGGMELANAFSELVDAEEQRHRFEAEASERRALQKTVHPIDEELLAALSAIPSAGGIALGVDRLAMLLTGAPSIEDVLFFPT